MFPFKKHWLERYYGSMFAPFVISTPRIWARDHVVSHHVHTFTEKDRQDNYPFKRVQRELKHLFFHRWQHLYVWLVYPVGIILWTFNDFVKSLKAVIFDKVLLIPRKLMIWDCFLIGINLSVNVALPFITLSWQRSLMVVFCTNILVSLLTVFQIVVNHEVVEVLGTKPDEAEGKIDWGEHQVRTSHSYGSKSPFWLHISGGLNMQLEHHLFPAFHYSRFPELYPIIRDACKEYGLPYHQSEGLFEALCKHYKCLKIGSKP